MYVITEEGRIYEGLALTPEEAKIFEELGESGEFSAHTSGYISQSDSRKLAAYLCSNFILVRRKTLVQEPEMDSIEPDFIPESYSYDELTAKDSTIAENFPGIAGA
jgi:hypothetical protein